MLDRIVGQKTAARYLAAVVSGRLTRPLILHGPEGTGRRTGAVFTTRTLLCTGDRTYACACLNCEQIRQDVHPDVVQVRAGEKDIGVEAVREVLASLLDYPSQGAFRVVILEGVDRLTPAAAGALLKTLEEPPPFARFFLLAHDIHAVIPTIRSRCGEVFFLPLPLAFVQSVLSQHEPDTDKALVISRLSEGSVGRALQFWGGGKLVLRDKILSLLQAASRRDLQATFSLVDSLERDIDLGCHFLDLLLHDLLMLPTCPDRCLNQDRLGDLRELGPKGPRRGWDSLRVMLRGMAADRRATKIQVPFHLKSIFAEAFLGG